MYPFGHLPGNLAAFCGVLRRTHGFRIGPGEINDAARALEVVDVAHERLVRDALRAVLSSSQATARVFDDAFDAFFFPGARGVEQPGQPGKPDRRPPTRDGTADEAASRAPSDPESDAHVDDDAAGGAGPVRMDDDAGATEEPAVRLARANYSPLEMEGRQSVRLRPVDAQWRAGAHALVRRLRLGISRRWRPGRRGRRFDLRRTWRASLQTGGEALTARWLRRVHRSPRFAILIDGSRSMERADAAALDLAVAVASVTSHLEVYVFSTALRSVTHEVRAAAGGRAVTTALTGDTWGGGTNIGASLRAFLQRHGDRHVRRDTLVVIVSDGLDVGEPDDLRAAMRELHRRAAGIAWLNPLVDTPGYEPTSRGMAAARPFVTTFANVPDAEGLTRLARVVRLR